MKTWYKIIILAALASLMLMALSACGSNSAATSSSTSSSSSSSSSSSKASSVSQSSSSTSASTTSSSASSTAASTTPANGNKAAVIYFSWTGNVDNMAHWIADATGADLYRVTTANPYPEDYNQTVDIAKRENDNNERPEIRVDITADRLAGYDKVFFGFPIWWYDMPMAMYTFLDSYSLQGKTIIPFFSHEGSSNGASSLQNLERLAGGRDSTIK